MESCILIITRTNDATADHAICRLKDRNIPYLRLNTDTFGAENIALRFPNVYDSILSVGGESVSLRKIRGVWLRRLSKPKAENVAGEEERTFAESELDFTLRWLINTLGNFCPVLDCEARLYEARNKFNQLTIAEDFGFSIPATLVTNDPVAARDFVRQHEAVVIKSVAGYGRQAEGGGFYTSYTKLVTPDILERFEDVRYAPVCLQEYIGKEFELRITVVGQKVFACRIDSQATERTEVDWRRYDPETPYSAYPVSRELSGQLIAMMAYYRIRFASFDFVFTPDGRTIFLEMNPATEFLWIETDTGMPITDAIIDVILEGRK